jgi:Na+/H+ antiporter NhaD/arsenite permease-like protein
MSVSARTRAPCVCSRAAALAVFAIGAACAGTALAAPVVENPVLLGIPIEFILFALTLMGVAAFHHHTLSVALSGLVVITIYKLGATGFSTGPGLDGLLAHLHHEWVILTNLLCLLVGFALLSRHFEESRVPAVLPRFLPDDWKGAFTLLVLIWIMSGFLDNIAAALIGATIAGTVFRGRVHIGYLAAVVAASNAGGAGSVVGDTTTTMMWLDGVSPLAVLPAYLPAAVALVVFGIPAALQQQRHSPIVKHEGRHAPVDWTRIGIVAAILVAAIATNVTVNLRFKHLADAFPFIGAAVWIAIVACAPLRQPHWRLVPEAFKGSIFLLALVLCASMMPVEKLPPPSWQSSLSLGFISAVFDNIPLTALALNQGGYDWAMLAYAVGFGGSMIWFGSSAGVAVSNIFPQAKSVWEWLRYGWHIPLGYVAGYVVMLLLLGWQPTDRNKPVPVPVAAAALPGAGERLDFAGFEVYDFPPVARHST